MRRETGDPTDGVQGETGKDGGCLTGQEGGICVEMSQERSLHIGTKRDERLGLAGRLSVIGEQPGIYLRLVKLGMGVRKRPEDDGRGSGGRPLHEGSN